MTIDVVVKILAVVGGAVVGGLGLGLLGQLLARAFTVRKMPPWPLRTVRLLGGGICGWLVALWLFGGGGAGIGGTGGWGFGSRKGNGQENTEVVKKDGESRKTADDGKAPATDALRIEVLGRAVLPKADIDGERWYRVETEDGSRLLTFADVKEVVKSRQRKQPPLHRIAIVLYNNSPAQNVPVVSQLIKWASELNDGKMKVDISQPDANAPVK